MSKTVKSLRRTVREVLAVTFWAHSLFVVEILHAHGLDIAGFPRYAFNFALIVFIGYYSYFGDFAWFSVVWDLIFVYCYPFIVTKRILWFVTKSFWQFFKKRTTLPKLRDVAPAVAVASTSAKEIDKKKPEEKVAQDDEARWEFALRPFLRFNVLWAFLVLTVDYRPFLWFIVAVCICGSARALWMLHAFLADASAWTAKLRSNIANQMAEAISLIGKWNEGSDSAEALKRASVLRILETTFSFIDQNRKFLSRLTWSTAIILSAPFYLYISYLCAAAYFAISKAEHIPWSFSAAFLDALYVPFAFTDLPHSFLIRSFAGLQAIAVTLIGWNAFSTHLNGQLQGMVQAASEFQTALASEQLIGKRRVLEAIEIDNATKAKPVNATVNTIEPPTQSPEI